MRGGDGDQDPEQERDDQAGDGGCFQRDGDRGVVDVAVQAAAEMGDGLDAMEDGGGQQEGEDGERGDGDEQHVDGAGQVLAAAAVGAVGEVLIVVRAHGGREAGDVITPTGEDVSDERIGAVRDGHAV